MPQATDEQRTEWNGPMEDGAMKFLADAGWKQRRDWCWVPPTPEHVPTDREISAIQFPIDEWDMGGIVRRR